MSEPALQRIVKTAFNRKRRIDREQQRQARGFGGIEALDPTALIPDALQSAITDGLALEHLGRTMMQEATKRGLTETAVGHGMHDQFMPQIVYDLRRHGNRAESGTQIGDKEVA